MGVANARLQHGEAPTAATGAPDARARRRAVALVPVDEEVLRDLWHEVGNYFHKLYYWSDYIKSGADDLGPDSSPGQMLEQNVHDLEDFLRATFEYFRPTSLEPVRMSGSDLARALEGVLRAETGGMSTVEAEEGTDTATVVIDPSRLSAALRTIARHLAGTEPAAALKATVAKRSAAGAARPGDVVEIAIEAARDASSTTPRPSGRVADWALARRTIELHGGELTTREGRQGPTGCVLTLPLAS